MKGKGRGGGELRCAVKITIKQTHVWDSVQQNHACDTLSNFPGEAKKSSACIEMYGLIINSVPNNFMMDSPILDA